MKWPWTFKVCASESYIAAQLYQLARMIHDEHVSVIQKLESLERKIGKLMATEDDILDKVTAQTTLIDSIRVLVEQLKANAGDPAKLAAIISALDANSVALAAVANT